MTAGLFVPANGGRHGRQTHATAFKFTRAAAASMRFVSDSGQPARQEKAHRPKASGRTTAGDSHPTLESTCWVVTYATSPFVSWGWGGALGESQQLQRVISSACDPPGLHRESFDWLMPVRRDSSDCE